MAVFDPARLTSDKVDERAALLRLARLEQRARLILAFETLWSYIVAALTLLGFVTTLALVGAIELLPPALRGFTFASTIGGAIALILRGILSLRVTREDALERIDDNTDLAHRPALSLADYSASHLDDPLTFALWRTHRKNLVAHTKSLRLTWPHPHVHEKDPYALRFAVLIALIAALLVNGPDAKHRLDAALIWTSQGEAIAKARLDGWIDPPAYTGLPPILFDFQSQEQSKAIRAPIGSTIILRRSDSNVALPDVSGQILAEETRSDQNEHHFTLKGNGAIAAQNMGRNAISIEAIPDLPPSILITSAPQKTSSGGISLSFHIEDDYGVVSGSTRIINPRIHDKPLTGQHPPLIDAPVQALALSGDKRNSDGRLIIEPNESPWAGATVDLALMVQDDLGQIAETSMMPVRLPERLFTMPVAKALIEERRRLALDPSTLPRVRESIDLLMTAPELFQISAAEYLGLREIRSSLDEADKADDLKTIVDLMWNLALTIERGGSDDTEKALNAAQEALRNALESGAPDEEIKALSEKLKDALDAYLKDYAQRALKQMQQFGEQQQQTEHNGRAIRPEDLKSMLDRMQEMAKNGARDDAARMLDALSSILKNLQASPPRLGNPSQSKNAQALDGLDKMLRDQRGLRDDTYKEGRSNPDAGHALGERQKSLRDELDKLRDGMKGLEQNGQNALGDAGNAMQQAEDALKQSDIPGALRGQNKALEGLRAGAQALAKQMQDENGEGQNSNGQNPGDRSKSGQSTEEDPLGRENGSNVSEGGSVNEQGGAKSAGDRARNVLNELRKRLGQDERSKDERDYYRRLIGPN